MRSEGSCNVWEWGGFLQCMVVERVPAMSEAGCVLAMSEIYGSFSHKKN